MEDVHVLCFDAARRVEHKYANVAVFDGPYGAHDAVELEVFGDFVFSSDSGCVDEIKVKPELAEACVDAVARGSGYLGDDVAVFADERVDDAAFACVWSPDDGETGYLFFDDFWIFLRKHVYEGVE